MTLGHPSILQLLSEVALHFVSSMIHKDAGKTLALGEVEQEVLIAKMSEKWH